MVLQMKIEGKTFLFTSSTGGHLEELLMLEKLKNYSIGKTILITEKSSSDIQYWQDKCYFMPKMNRKEWKSLIKYAGVFIKTIQIMFKENPDVIVSTGAMITFPCCIIGKILGKKIIYIETMANVHTKSMTGKMVYKFADIFIVQWESMLQLYPNAVYGGKIF